MTEGWEDRAADWVRFARTEGHDAYWRYRDRFFELLPPPAEQALEVGCGEGRVCRDLRARGYAVTGLDASTALVAAAREADPTGSYLVGAAEELPFEASTFELVVTYNSLMDVADMPSAVREIARVLVPGGRFCACVLHPIADAGRFEPAADGWVFVISEPYLAERDYEIVSDRDGIRFTFRSRRYPLEAYARALEQAGLLIESLREPVVSAPERVGKPPDRWDHLPMFLHFRSAKAATTS